MFMHVLFYPGQLSHFPLCIGAGVTNLNERLSSFLLPLLYCGLGAGSIHFGAIVIFSFSLTFCLSVMHVVLQ